MNSFERIDYNWVNPNSPWKLVRGKYLFNNPKEINTDFKEYNLLSLTLNGVLNKNMDSGKGLRPETYETYQIFQKDNLVFKLIDLENVKTSRVGWVHERGLMSPVYIRLESKELNLNTKYYYHYYYDLYKREIYNSIGSGVRSSLSGTDLLELLIPTPSIEEQNQIVRYIQIKTLQIDELVEKVEKKIKLLKEQRNSLFNEVITKGLNPNIEMKDSGVEWIGEIPSHWGVKKLKYLSDIKLSNVDKHIFEDELQVKFCNYTHVYYNEFIDRTIKFDEGSCNENEFSKFKLEKGDVILTKDSETRDDIGVPTLVIEDLDDVVCGYHLTMIKPKEVLGSYVFRFIQSDIARRYCEVNSQGVTRFGLGKPSIQNLFIPLPSKNEQLEIVEYLNQKTKVIDVSISKEEKRTELLKEYKQILISEVVTGKKRVTEDMI